MEYLLKYEDYCLNEENIFSDAWAKIKRKSISFFAKKTEEEKLNFLMKLIDTLDKSGVKLAFAFLIDILGITMLINPMLHGSFVKEWGINLSIMFGMVTYFLISACGFTIKKIVLKKYLK